MPSVHSWCRRQGDETNPVGNLELIEDWTGVTSNMFDERNLLVSTTNPDGQCLTSTDDAARQRIGLTDPEGGVTTFGYDSASRRRSRNRMGIC